MKKTIRNIISLVLVAALSVSLLSAAAFAKGFSWECSTGNEENLLIIGDSTAEKFKDNVKGYNKLSLVTPNLRPYDIYNIFNFTFEGKDTSILADLLKMDADNVNDFIDNNLGQVKKIVKDADVIAYDLGMDNLGSYLYERLIDILNQYVGGTSDYETKYADQTIDEILPQDNADISALISAFNKTIKIIFNNKFGSEWNKLADYSIKVNEVINALAYACAIYAYYFDKSIDAIMELKDEDTELVVFGLYNAYEDVVLNVKFENIGKTDEEGNVVVPHNYTIPVGDIFGLIVNALNVYMTSKSAYASEYKFADLQDTVYGTSSTLEGVYTNLDAIKDTTGTVTDKDVILSAAKERVNNNTQLLVDVVTYTGKNGLLFHYYDKDLDVDCGTYFDGAGNKKDGFEWDELWDKRFVNAMAVKAGNDQYTKRLAYSPLYIWMLYEDLNGDGVYGDAYQPYNSACHEEAFADALNSTFAANGYTFNGLINRLNKQVINGSGTLVGTLVKSVLDSQRSFAARAAEVFQKFNTVAGFISDLLERVFKTA